MLNIFRTRLVLPALRLARAGPISSLAAFHPARVPPSAIVGGTAAAFSSRRGFTSSSVCLETAAAAPKRKGRTTSAKSTTTKTKKKAATTPKKPRAKSSVKASGTATPGPRKKKVVKRPVGRPRTAKPPRPKPIPKELKPPKQTPNTFAVFYGKFRQGVTSPKSTKEDNSAIMKEAASVWKSLSEFEKRPFAEEAAEYRKEYAEKFAAWSQLVAKERSTLRRLNVRRKKYGRSKLKPRLPKDERRPVNAFFRYLEDSRDNYSGLRKEQVKAAAVAWKALDEDVKKPYYDQFKEDHEKWKATHGTTSAPSS